MRPVKYDDIAFRTVDDEGAFWDAFEGGAWEPLTLATLRAFGGPGTVLLDVGAWVGPTTLAAAALGADVVAVEADPVALDALRASLGANPDLAPRVTVLPRALAPAAGTVRLGARKRPGRSMSSTLLADAEASWSAETVTPEQLADLLPAGRPTLVKIDIEGGEYALGGHLGPLLRRPRTAALVSLHPAILAQASGPRALAAATGRLLDAFADLDAFLAGPGGWRAARPGDPAVRALARQAATDWLLTGPDAPCPGALREDP